ncbi:response regulator transcription factor [Mucilaginibacter glaciei]|uniref:Response regulator transcription factor n=1 Tax=Mucilaginibacter glaciei TaxID=2772109 RepID=A0A926NTN6_9SPHI|nr:response regulator transcription factor [Mucilaginibacter glaciei]MBD1391573.1 response regulator transcription factor [Mucilaginibacter glaciei]
MYKILVLEDDHKMAAELRLFFSNRGFDCDLVYDGGTFFKQLDITKYDIYILDVNVPVLSGTEVCKRIRVNDKQTPVLMLTAYSAVQDKVDALAFGADDYLVKPFHLEELLARVSALLRRSSGAKNENEQLYKIDDLIINTVDLKVSRGGDEIALTPKEYKLLELLASAQGRTVSKQTIATKVWDINFETGTNTIEVYINYLRNKIDKGRGKALIHTRAGFGYSLKIPS